MEVQERRTISCIAETFSTTIEGQGSVGTGNHAHHDPRAIGMAASMGDGIRLVNRDDARLGQQTVHRDRVRIGHKQPQVIEAA
jgi:hypothetical protein